MGYWSARAAYCCPVCKHIDSSGHCKLGKMCKLNGREFFFLIGECSSYEGPLEVGSL